MKTLLEITEWSGNTPNHVYFVSDSRDRMFGYVPAGRDIPVKFSKPIKFDAGRRRFQVVPNQWNFVAKTEKSQRSWTVTGSKGNQYIVTENNNRLTCSCPGFQYRGQCRHAQEKVSGLGNL